MGCGVPLGLQGVFIWKGERIDFRRAAAHRHHHHQGNYVLMLLNKSPLYPGLSPLILSSYANIKREKRLKIKAIVQGARKKACHSLVLGRCSLNCSNRRTMGLRVGNITGRPSRPTGYSRQ